MIKEVIFDADGVVLKPYKKPFSQRLAERQGLLLGEVGKFFDNEYRLCVTGRMDLRKSLSNYLESWKWDGTVDELIQYWIQPEGIIDNEILNRVDILRTKGIWVGLATDKSLIHGDYILENLGLGYHFDNVFLSCRLGVTKSNPDFYHKIIEATGLKASKIQFWDDDQKNVDVAYKTGIDARLFVNTENFRFNLDQF